MLGFIIAIIAHGAVFVNTEIRDFWLFFAIKIFVCVQKYKFFPQKNMEAKRARCYNEEKGGFCHV